MTMMKAAISYGSSQRLVIEERPIPRLAAGDVLVQVERCGICGSDLRTRKGAPRLHPAGHILGHEYSGRIVDVGADVEMARIGERIAAYPGAGCGDCPACRNDHPILCPNGRHVMGGFAEYAAMPASCAVPLPEGFDPAEGALVEPLAVGRYAVRCAAIRAGDPVLIIGAGTIALAVIYWARRMGAGQITVLSRSDRRAPAAQRFGADRVVAFNNIDDLGDKPAAVFECTGAPGLLQQAIDLGAFASRVVSLGSSPLPEPIAPASAGRKAVTLHFPIGYTTGDFVETATTLHHGNVDVREMVSNVVPLDALPDVFETLLAPNRQNKVQVAL
ncbi:alcohol dehydrogenase catalytic domain-containing protein [Sphingomonas sp. 67-36]|nr:alcohol dehydrogenase catalytic domain-containing protein [Sphingomonas sp. 67-36]